VKSRNKALGHFGKAMIFPRYFFSRNKNINYVVFTGPHQCEFLILSFWFVCVLWPDKAYDMGTKCPHKDGNISKILVLVGHFFLSQQLVKTS